MAVEVPDRLARRMLDVWKERAAAWLAGFPALLAHCERRWALTQILPPVDYLSYNYVAPALQAGGAAVILKLGVPNPEMFSEIAALRLYGGHGAVRLIDADEERGVLVLEWLRPGTALTDLEDDQQATAIAGQVAKRLWQPLPEDHPFPSVARWAAGLGRVRDRFDGGTGPLPTALVEQAEALFAELLAGTGPEGGAAMLVHGDLNRGNVLRAEREPWLAIDPKGLAGDPGYDLAIILKDLLDEVPPETGRRLLARRADLLAEMIPYDRQRLLRWGMAQQVLSAWWHIEDHGEVSPEVIGVAELLRERVG